MADNIFPFIDATVVDIAEQVNVIPKEYNWDIENNEFVLINGKTQIVEGLDALKIRVYKSLITERYRYLIYSWDYGSEFDTLIGKGYSNELTAAEARRMTEDALKEYFTKGWITAINNFDISFVDNRLSISFTMVTPFGEANISV